MTDPRGTCFALGCDEPVDPDVTVLCRRHHDEAADQLVDDGEMDPDDRAHEHGYITEDGEYVEAPGD